MSGAGAPVRRLARADRERQVVDAAHALFAERGFSAVTMDDVAAAVGVTKPLLYNYFGNKEKLYLACMEPAGEALVTTVTAAVEGAADPPAVLHDGVSAFFAFVDQDRDAWRVLFDETTSVSPEIAQRVNEYRERLVGMVALAMLAQARDPTSPRARARAEAIATALLGGAEALARWWLRTGATTAGEAADLFIATVEPGLLRRER